MKIADIGEVCVKAFCCMGIFVVYFLRGIVEIQHLDFMFEIHFQPQNDALE